MITDEAVTKLIKDMREIARDLERDPRMLKSYARWIRKAMREAGVAIEVDQ